jgi:hypothetical protein
MQLADDVLAFLQEVPPAPFGPLAADAAVRATEQLWARSTLAEAMGLVVLNDTEDSNHYCVVTRGPGAGAVVFVPHDDGPSFAFSSLAALRDVMQRAAVEGTDIWDIEPENPAPYADQAQLREHLRASLSGGADEGAPVFGMLLPLLDPDDVETLRLAATDRDFLVRESAARFMASAPRVSQRALLKVLVADRYLQVAQPALEALSALERAP